MQDEGNHSSRQDKEMCSRENVGEDAPWLDDEDSLHRQDAGDCALRKGDRYAVPSRICRWYSSVLMKEVLLPDPDIG